jgi:hypothetical protein
MRTAATRATSAATAYSAQLSARYRNFLVPLLTLGAVGGFNALLVARSGSGDAGWWPVAWLATVFLGVFFSAAFTAIAGRRKLPVAYGIAMGAVVGLGLTAYGLLQTRLHAPWAATLPAWSAWLSSPQARTWLSSPWAPLIPYAAGLAWHGAAMLVFNRRTSPENRG